jgi:hypothetical protein
VPELLYDWRFTTNQFVLVTSPLRLTTSSFISQLNTCCYSSYVTSSLTRGWVCRLQLLLVLASAVILSSESCGTHDHILLSQIRDSPKLEGQDPVFISPRTEWPSYTPRHWVPFSSPPTTLKATVEVFDPASGRTLTQPNQSQSRSYFTTDGLPPISSSSQHAPWDPPQRFFFHLNPCGGSPYVTSSLTWILTQPNY